MTPPSDTPPVDLLNGITPALEPDFRLDHLVELSRERALYRAWDRRLKRSVALRVHLIPDSPGRAWFLRENETLAALNHPAVRHVYAASEVGPFAYRTTNWIDGESMAEAMRRGPRPIPSVMSLVRDLLGALEHAHARGIIIRRIVPTTLILELSGRGVITDLRYSNWCLSHVPGDDPAQATPFAAPEVRAGEPGEPASDVYAIAAIVYYALTGREPETSTGDGGRFPRAPCGPRFRPRWSACCCARCGRCPEERYFTATEMLEDFVSDAGRVPRAGGAPTDDRERIRATSAPRARRRLRAAGGDRVGRLRPGVPGARPGARAGGGHQGLAPDAHGRSRA